MRGPNHYDDLKRPPQPEDNVVGQTPNSQPPLYEPPAAPEERLREQNAVDEMEQRIAARDAVYSARRADNERLVEQNAALQRDEMQRDVGLQRADNARLVAENEARQHQEQRLEQDRNVQELADENAKKLVDQARTMRELHTRFEAYGQNPIELVERQVDNRAGGRDVSGDRYHQALAQQGDERDPYGTLERSAMAENSAFHRDQEQLQRRIDHEENLDAKRTLEQRKDIQAADHITATSHRVADQSEIITGVRADDDGIKFRDRALEYEARSAELQEDYRQRTGRSDWDAEPEQAPDKERQDQSTRHETQSEQAPQTSSGAEEKQRSEWEAAGVEITDAKAERLGKLADFGESSSSTRDTPSPTRPVSTGRTGR